MGYIVQMKLLVVKRRYLWISSNWQWLGWRRWRRRRHLCCSSRSPIPHRHPVDWLCLFQGSKRSSCYHPSPVEKHETDINTPCINESKETSEGTHSQRESTVARMRTVGRYGVAADDPIQSLRRRVGADGHGQRCRTSRHHSHGPVYGFHRRSTCDFKERKDSVLVGQYCRWLPSMYSLWRHKQFVIIHLITADIEVLRLITSRKDQVEVFVENLITVNDAIFNKRRSWHHLCLLYLLLIRDAWHTLKV